MATVPFSGVPDVGQSTSSLGRQDINASPEAFGGGLATGLEDIGQTLMSRGEILTRHAVKFQLDDDRAAASNSYFSFLDGANAIYYGDSTTPGFKNLHGAAAYTGINDAHDRLTKLHDDIAAQLPNDQARRLFEQDSRLAMRYTLVNMSEHAATERNRYFSETQNGLVAGAQANATLHHNDPTVIADSLLRVDRALTDRAMIEGWAPERLISEKAIADSKLITDVIRKTAIDDPWGAFAMYNQQEAQLTAQDSIFLGSLFKSTLPAVARVNIENSILGGYFRIPPSDKLLNAIRDDGEHGHIGDKSYSGALGPYQIQPETGIWLAKQAGVAWDAHKAQYDEAYGRNLAKTYTDILMQKYAGNAALASIAYNAGPGNVDDWINGTNKQGHNPELVRLGDPNKGEISVVDFIAGIPTGGLVGKDAKAYGERVTGALGMGPGVILTDPDPKAHLNEFIAEATNASTYADTQNPQFHSQLISGIRGTINAIDAANVATRVDANRRLSEFAMGDPLRPETRPNSWAEFVQRDPNWQEDYAKLLPVEKTHLVNMIAANGSGQTRKPSLASMALFQQLQGQAILDPEKFKQQNFNTVGGGILPYTDRRSLMELQIKLSQNPARNTDILHALSVAHNVGLGKIPTLARNPTAHAQFVGRLNADLETFAAVHGRKANDADIIKMTQALMLKPDTGFFSFFGGTREFENEYSSRIQEVPIADRAAIHTSYVRKFGKEPSDGQIVYWYLRGQNAQ